MLTIKRLYLYAVLGVSLALLLWGLADLMRFALEAVVGATGSRPALGDSYAREELSRALALVVVGGSIFGLHLAFVRRTLRGDPAMVADERACASRATYFFLLLVGTGIVLLWALFDVGYQLVVSTVFGEPGWHPEGALGSALVVGAAWLLHVRARAADLRLAPDRTAGDWLTRGYLYGALLLTAIVFALQSGEVLTAAARKALDMPPLWEAYRWWQEAIAGPVVATIVVSGAWLAHWLMAERLRRAPDPMGAAHRSSHTRRGYFLVVLFAAAAAALVLGSVALRELLAIPLGAAGPNPGDRLLEDVGGPLLMVVPFATVGWWHARRGAREALALEGPLLQRSVVRLNRLLVAVVGLAGLAAGLAWQLQGLIDTVGSSARESLYTSGSFAEVSSGALAVALVGLVLWLPAWATSQAERANRPLEVAEAMSRRAYLVLVSGLAVIAAMGSLAYLVWQGTRLLLDSGNLDDPSWAVSILVVALVVLLYHLWQLRSDLRVVHASQPAAGAEAAGQAPATSALPAHETIEIWAPPGADFGVLNAAIRSELPDGYELRVLPASLSAPR